MFGHNLSGWSGSTINNYSILLHHILGHNDMVVVLSSHKPGIRLPIPVCLLGRLYTRVHTFLISNGVGSTSYSSRFANCKVKQIDLNDI